jgi:hypothetical protein
MLLWPARNKSKNLQKDEFLVYAACFGFSRYVMEALVKREICDQPKSDILLAISARVKLNSSQEDIALVEDLLDRGADPNYRGCVLKFDDRGLVGRWLIASPFCEFLAEILQANLLSATKLSIQRVCQAMDGFLRHGANTSDLVNLTIRILDSGEVEFVSIKEYNVRLDDSEEAEEEDIISSASFSSRHSLSSMP